MGQYGRYCYQLLNLKVSQGLADSLLLTGTCRRSMHASSDPLRSQESQGGVTAACDPSTDPTHVCTPQPVDM